jgi:two-component system, NarL family, response regulator LiaR
MKAFENGIFIRPMRTLIADDHPIVRAGIVSMLSKEPDIQVIVETGDGEQVERLAAETRPDVLVLDVNMPGLDPIATTRRLNKKYPALQILILTAHDDEAYVTGLLSAGATGYVLKDEALDSLVEAIRTISAGESWLSQRIAGRLARKAIARTDARSTAAEPLTPREGQVLRLLALGLSNEEIAEQLVITKRTVQNHVSNIYGKLGLDSRAEAVLYAIRHGVVDVKEVKGL